jgi:7-carboxy-7-deazaguanine synthase (Cx14CxxC type)
VTYAVKEIFYTLQGEGIHAGRPAVFCRFAGCNLWSGREPDRTAAVCRFCDTDFVGVDGTLGGKYDTAELLGERIAGLWPSQMTHGRFVVLTGGEPLLQVDQTLLRVLHAHAFQIAVETNGSIEAPHGIDWICVSPKAGAPLAQTSGQELKLVFPQAGLLPASVESLEFDHLLLQPMDGPNRTLNTIEAIKYCQANPRWRLSIQLHKVLGIR